MSVLWIAILSFGMVTLVARAGCLIGIDSYTMGLVVIAVGTSVPVSTYSLRHFRFREYFIFTSLPFLEYSLYVTSVPLSIKASFIYKYRTIRHPFSSDVP